MPVEAQAWIKSDKKNAGHHVRHSFLSSTTMQPAWHRMRETSFRRHSFRLQPNEIFYVRDAA